YSTDVPKPIPDFANGVQGLVTSTLNISGIGTISDINLVGLVISHTYIQDLRVTLRAPNNTQVRLIGQICAGEDDFSNITLDDQAAAAVNSVCPPTPGGTFRPAGAAVPPNALATFNGLNASGTWTLIVTDNAAQDTGTLIAWGLDIKSAS